MWVGPGVRAIGVTEYGGPEQLRELDLAAEPLGVGQVRVRVTAAAVSPTDTLRRAGAQARGVPLTGAVVPGMDVAGTVAEIGDGVRDLSVGERVMGIVLPDGEHGGYREDLVLPAASVVRVPKGTTDAEAASLPMNALTAREALDKLALRPRQVLLVTGAAGAFGGYVVQLAKADGLRVVADAKASDEDLVTGLGAALVLRRGAGFIESVRAAYPDGVDGVADGALLGAEALALVRDGGAVATVRGYEGDGRPGVRVETVWVRDRATDHDALDRLRAQVEQGALTPRVADVLPAAEAAEAHRRLEAGGVRGRLVLDFS